jgi:hypothetical protein
MAVAARNGMYCAKVPGKRPLHAADHRRVHHVSVMSFTDHSGSKMEPTLQRLSARNSQDPICSGRNGSQRRKSVQWARLPFILHLADVALIDRDTPKGECATRR